MDTKKEPGIIMDSIFVVESKFSRSGNVDQDIFLQLEVDIKQSYISESECDVIFTFNAEGRRDNDHDVIDFTIETRHVAKFIVDGENKNMEFDKFIRMNAPAIMFPYIRSHIHNLTMNSGMKPVLLPPMNISKMLQDIQTEREEIETE